MSHGNFHVTQTSASNNDYVRALVNSGYHWDTFTETGNSNQIRFTFAGSGFDAGQANSVRLALGRWAAVADIDLAEVVGATPSDLSPREDVELLILLTSSGDNIGGFGGYSGTPYEAFNDNTTATVNGDTILLADRGRTYTYIARDAQLNGRAAFDSSGNFTNAGFLLTMHEIGHALGLKHPHDYGAANFPFLFPGVTQNDASDLGDNSLNQNLYSIMSYNDATIGHDSATPMAFDIAAIQTLYGARASASTGNDTYTIPDPGSATTWRCIWDTGGIDSIRYNGTADSIINLRPATLDNSATGGGSPSYSYGPSSFGSGFTIAGDITGAIADQNGVTGVIIENAYGGSGKDLLGGNDVDNILDGGTGADTMRGFGGSDTYYVDNVGDTVTEAVGGGTNDRVNTTLTSYTLGANVEFLDFQGPSSTGFSGTGNDLANTIQGYFGADILDGRAGADTMRGYTGDDTYYVDNAGDVVSDSDGNDRVNTTLTSYTLGAGIEVLDYQGESSTGFRGTGNASDNTVQGWGGDDILDGKAGADLMRGYGGNDRFYVDNAEDQVNEVAGNGSDRVLASVSYTLAAGQSIEVLATTDTAGTAAINLTGNEFAQTIQGNAGANLLLGGGGGDIMSGYGGNDTYIVGDAGDRVNEAAGGGTHDSVLASFDYVLAAGQDIEEIGIVGHAGTDFAIDLTGNEKVQTLTGSFAANTLDGKGGADTMVGYAGDDRYFVDNAGDKVIEATEGGLTDSVFASLSYKLAVGQEIEVLGTTDLLGTAAINLTGNEKAQTILGNFGANVLDGKAGADLLYGYNGNDTYYVDNAGDRVIETNNGGTADRVLASVSYTLEAGQQIEFLVLNNASNVAGTGNAFNNTITGSTGSNQLAGLEGSDRITGGAGADTFVYKALGDSTVAAAGRDFIADFGLSEGDRIDLRLIDANTGLGGDQAFSFVGGAAFSNKAGELRSVVAGGNTLVSGDVNGDGTADFSIVLSGNLNLERGDFLV